MVEKASYSSERSVDDVEAFQVGFNGSFTYGREWSYKANGAITKIFVISFNELSIASLVFQTIDDHGIIEYSQSLGYDTNQNVTVETITLEPQEYLTSLTGTTYNSSTDGRDYYLISSVAFETNKGRKLGPHGPRVTEDTFDFELKDKVIVGFYGCVHHSYNLVRGFGVYVKPSSDFFAPSASPLPIVPKHQFGGPYKEEECIRLQWGWVASVKDQQWSYMFKDSPTTIQIGYSEKYIQSISFKSSNETNEFKYSSKSASTPKEQKSFQIYSPEEFFIAIEGTISPYYGEIESICFFTNKTMYGPYGSGRGNRFKFFPKRAVIAGFHGSVDNHFYAFGVHVKPFPESRKEESEPIDEVKPNQEFIKVGPRGGPGGEDWDYKPTGAITITEIIIHSGDVIDSLSFKSTNQNDVPTKYGGGGGDEKVVTLEPNEYVTSIKGTYGKYKDEYVIESLSFYTNIHDKVPHGPFGHPKGIEFVIPEENENRIIVGFHGRHDKYINALGVYLKKPTV